MNDVYSSRPLKRKKCKTGFIEVNGVCVPIREAQSSSIQSFDTTPPTPPEPKKEIDTIQPRNSDLGLSGVVVGTTIGVGGVGYGAYRNRGAIQRNMRRITQRKMKVDEEQGLLQEDEDFFRSQQSTSGQRVRQRNVTSRPREIGTAEERSPFLRRTPRGSDIEMGTTRVTTTTESEGQFFEPQKPSIMSAEEQEALERLEKQLLKPPKNIDPPDKIPTLEELAGKTKGQSQIAKKVVDDASKDVKGSKMKFGGESEAPIDDGNPFNIPIEDRPPISEVGGGKTSVIDDMVEGISKKVGDIPPVENINPFIESIGANEEAVIGASEAVAGDVAIDTIGGALTLAAPELAFAVVAGGAMYGLVEGTEYLLDVGSKADKRYIENRNKEGTHEMDNREKVYKAKELDKMKKYYEDQVNYHNSGKDTATMKQHEQDKAMLVAINKNIDAIKEHNIHGTPIYLIVDDEGNQLMISNEDLGTIASEKTIVNQEYEAANKKFEASQIAHEELMKQLEKQEEEAKEKQLEGEEKIEKAQLELLEAQRIAAGGVPGRVIRTTNEQKEYDEQQTAQNNELNTQAAQRRQEFIEQQQSESQE